MYLTQDRIQFQAVASFHNNREFLKQFNTHHQMLISGDSIPSLYPGSPGFDSHPRGQLYWQFLMIIQSSLK